MRIVPIWVNLPGLPIQCWAEENLGRIASLLGKPICTDRLTAECERISYARVLVEMDITQPLPNESYIEIPDGRSWMQNVKFEWKPKFCLECYTFGHNTGDCQKDVQQEEGPRKQRRRRNKKTTMKWKPKVVNNRGKQVVVVKGPVDKAKYREVNYDELAKRNAFAALTILERPSDGNQQQQVSRNGSGQLTQGSTSSNHNPP
ncbi:uncharacterized protein [Nicotiana sylvestris]|uniref:Uncharacterized protein LOC104227398 n=1 Tax=Nicotiana sylvestris TaxID=4096 RepID=A0A1U7WKY0_NICSY|nr:PREDICTED: uncharacterized protein LOC104227398 [Nicotiana sylvestris]